MRAAAWGMVAAGVAAPLVRKRIAAPPLLTQTRRVRGAGRPVRGRAPLAHARRGGLLLQMWAYLAAYKTPHDDEEAQARRVHVDYPIAIDRVARPRRAADACACSVRWRGSTRPTASRAGGRSTRCSCGRTGCGSWCPHGSLAYILCAIPSSFPRAAVMTYAVFDIGASIYWVLPTAPPWYAASERGSRMMHGAEDVRRMMVEYGEYFWRDGWGPLYSVLGGNPLAAMPSLHFATSLMAARCSRRRAARGRARRRLHARRSGSRWCTWASTTSSTCSRAPR